MSVFGRQLEAARRMIAKYGQSVTFRTLTDGTLPDPNAPWLPGTPVSVDYAVKIAFFPNSTQNNEFLHYVQGTDVPAGTEVGYLSPSDRVLCRGIWWATLVKLECLSVRLLLRVLKNRHRLLLWKSIL